MEEGIHSLAGKERGVPVEEILKLFNLHKVRYLVIGGQAVRLEGLPRFSMDWDVFIPPRDMVNIEKINAVLGNIIDMPLVPIGPQDQLDIEFLEEKLKTQPVNR